MLPDLTSKQNEYLERLYLRALDAAEECYAWVVVTELPKYKEQYEAAMVIAQLLFELGNFEEDPRYREM